MIFKIFEFRRFWRLPWPELMVLAGMGARTVGSGRPGSGALARTDGSGGGGRE